MSSLVKEDLAKRLFGPRRQRLQEFIEVEGSGAERCYLCAAGTGAAPRAGGAGERGGGFAWVRGDARVRLPGCAGERGRGRAVAGRERGAPRRGAAAAPDPPRRPRLRQLPGPARTPRVLTPRTASSPQKTAFSPISDPYGLEL